MSELNLQAHGHKPSKELIYGLEDRPPLKDALFAALQHLLAIFVAICTPPLIIAGALGLDIETTAYLVSMSLMVSGIATFIQCRRFGWVGQRFRCNDRRLDRGNVHFPHLEVHPSHHHAACFRHRRDFDRYELDQGGHHRLRRWFRCEGQRHVR